MSESSVPAFKHRHNREGTWDSICVKCYLTVATAANEEGLCTAEEAHDCVKLWETKTSPRDIGSS